MEFWQRRQDRRAHSEFEVNAGEVIGRACVVNMFVVCSVVIEPQIGI